MITGNTIIIQGLSGFPENPKMVSFYVDNLLFPFEEFVCDSIAENFHLAQIDEIIDYDDYVDDAVMFYNIRIIFDDSFEECQKSFVEERYM